MLQLVAYDKLTGDHQAGKEETHCSRTRVHRSEGCRTLFGLLLSLCE